MSGILSGKKGIIFGALDENSIAWKTAVKSHEEGAEFILTNAPVAMRYGEIQKLAEQTNSEVVPADATSLEDLDNLFNVAIEKFGKLDFILHSIGMSINVRKGQHYTDMNYDWTQKGWDISAVSFHKVMKTAWDKDCMNPWGSILALSYIAAQRVYPGYNDMADNKAYLESIARNFGYYWGKEKKVRVNTISQSPTPTTAGKGVKGFGGFLEIADDVSPLGNATAEDCASLCVMMFSDYTKKMTLQNIYNDGGYSNTGVSDELVNSYFAGKKSEEE
ncbi:Enoyl-[acyl-carrier-protein] reductase [NADH] [Candidatus Ornithobacterium hominis]|uniref:enoyl-ACP reductase FabI n=1 Tax=Candidatus Ornithobacterium hominis TaxID=2497989 RepID=UPI0024BC1B30|nr:SDR family oxidoreductase [Candidatus Ornithobacterium hominis]CAI9430415.1 Enoyl-[acyl-carrier-protein] reductase [NADH] [Candidatus Ornithobacterium hominis]